MNNLPSFDRRCRQTTLTVSSTTLAVEVIDRLSQTGANCALVFAQQQLIGIFTERDVVQAVAHKTLSPTITIAALMQHPVVTISPAEAENLPTVMHHFCQQQHHHLPVVDHKGRVVRVLTPMDLCSAITACSNMLDEKVYALAQSIAEQQTNTSAPPTKDHCHRAIADQLQDIFNSAVTNSIASFRVTPDRHWTCEYQSPGCEALYGYTPQELQADPSLWLSRLHPDDRDTVVLPGLKRLFEVQQAIIEFRFEHKDGSLKWICGTFTARHDDTTGGWFVTRISKDISERKRHEAERSAVEAALQQSEERWQLAIAGTSEAIWDWNILTGKTFRSSQWFKLLGYAPDALTDNDDEWSKRIHPDDYDRVAAAQTAYLQHQAPEYSVEYRLQCQDGSYRWFHSRAKAIWDEQGNPVRLVGSMGDITDRKRIEAELHQQEAQFITAQQIAHVGSWEWNLETQQRQWSAETFRIFGLDPERSEPTEAEFIQMVHPDDRAHLQTQLQQTIDQKTALAVEYRVVRPDGTVRHVESRATVTVNAQSNAIKLSGAILDITERKRVEAALTRQEEQLRLTLEFTHIATWSWDLETDSVIWDDNHFRLLGLPPKSVPATYEQWRNAVHPNDIAWVEQALQRALVQHQDYEMEYRVVYPDGSIHWLVGKGRGLYSETGEPMQMLGVLLDITDRKQAEQRLRLYERMVSTTTDRMVLVDRSYVYQAANQAYQTWRQLPVEALVGHTVSEILGQDLFEQSIKPRLDRCLAGQTVQYEDWFSNPAATSQFLSVTYAPYIESDHTVSGAVISIRDITQLKHVEEALRESEARFQAFMNNSPTLAWITDTDGRILYLNQTYLRTFNLEAERAIGTLIADLYPTATAQQYLDNIRKVATTQQTIEAIETAPQADGTTREFLVYKFPLSRTDTGTLVGGVAIDITDRRRTEHLLELQAVITRNMAEGICLVRADNGMIVYANPKFEQMFGYGPGELINQHVSIVNYATDAIDAEAINQSIRAAVLQAGEASYEVHNVKRDGTPFWCSATTSVFEHADYGTVLVAVHQDITARKLAEAQIQESLREKEVLLKEIHHRVKNNLGIVNSLLQMQCRRTTEPQASAILRDSQNRIASIALVHEKLYRSKKLADIDFAQYITDLTASLFASYNIHSNNISLNVDVEKIGLAIEAAIPCGLIINELISNALKHAFPDARSGRIWVRLTPVAEETEAVPASHWLNLTVQDDGIGLPPDFDFHHPKTLGISLVRGLVGQLHGTIDITKQPGATFRITFPQN